jgi:hypothetical protein
MTTTPWISQTAFSEHPIQRHIPRVGLQAGDALALIADADELRTTPTASRAQMMESAIVVTRAAAETPAALIECDQRQQNQIEFACRDDFGMTRIGFGDAVPVYAHHAIGSITHEAHAAMTKVGDDR